jgi:hypothetical protein
MAFKSIIDDFKKIKTAIKEEKENKGSYSNPLIFKPVAVKDEEKTKFRIRFLPVQESKIGKPWIEAKYHMFERDGDNKYVKVLDPRIFNKEAKNPISDLATKLWNSDNALDKEKAKKYFTKKRYFTLVYVKEAPENQKEYVGKVLVFEAGQKIYEKLAAAIDDFDMCFWDPFKGKDFMLVVKQTGGEQKWPDYSQSNFIGSDGPIVEDEDEMTKIEKQLETVTVKSAIFDKEGVKSGKELEEILYGGLKAAGRNASEGEDLTETKEEPVAKSEPKPAAKPTAKPSSQKAPDFGDDNVAAKPTAKQEEKKKKEEEPSESGSMEFDVDISDLDIKF